MRERWIIALAVVAIAAAACGGGGGGGSTSPGSSIVPGSTPTTSPTSTAVGANPVPTASGVTTSSLGRANVLITLPKGTYAAATARRPQTIGTGTQSIVFTLLQQNGAAATQAPQTFGLTASSTGCTTNTDGSLTCTLPVSAPIGSDVFLAQTYDGLNGTGNLTGSGAVALSIGQNTTNTATISLSAQVANVYLASTSFYLGTPSDDDDAKHRRAQGVRVPQMVTTPSAVNSARVFVIALDSSGNSILNPSAYNAPIYLQLAFLYGEPDVSLSATYASNDPTPCTGTATASGFYGYLPVCSPSDVITASYVPGVTSGAYYGYIIGSPSSANLIPTPAPSASPAPFPSSPPTGSSFLEFYVYSTAAQSNNIVVTSGSTDLPVTSLDVPGITYAYYYISEVGYNGAFTVSAPTCSNATVTEYDGYEIFVQANSVGTCSATVTDGTNTITLPVTVTTTAVTGS